MSDLSEERYQIINSYLESCEKNLENKCNKLSKQIENWKRYADCFPVLMLVTAVCLLICGAEFCILGYISKQYDVALFVSFMTLVFVLFPLYFLLIDAKKNSLRKKLDDAQDELDHTRNERYTRRRMHT